MLLRGVMCVVEPMCCYVCINEYNTISDVFVLIENKSLTFRGAGPENTIIGPESAHNRSAAGFIALDMDFIRFENLSVENINAIQAD